MGMPARSERTDGPKIKIPDKYPFDRRRVLMVGLTWGQWPPLYIHYANDTGYSARKWASWYSVSKSPRGKNLVLRLSGVLAIGLDAFPQPVHPREKNVM
jgi:hypothetical protein